MGIQHATRVIGMKRNWERSLPDLIDCMAVWNKHRDPLPAKDVMEIARWAHKKHNRKPRAVHCEDLTARQRERQVYPLW